MWFVGGIQARQQQEGEEGAASLPSLHLVGTPQGGRSFPSCTDDDPLSEVRIYTCGPTVYDVPHIGNLRAFVVADTLHRVVRLRGHAVRHTMNITDFGHLTSDADEGEDKMLLALQREGLPRTMEAMREIADRYTAAFFADLDAINIPRDRYTFTRASDHVAGMIAIVRTLLERGYAYTTPDGIYFDTTTFPDYGILGNVREAKKEVGARVNPNPHKRHPEDFALWKFSSDPALGWDAPWGRGFPGWHTECVAMIFDTLGRSIHIHTGGEDHIAIHHNNEIAQAEAITGKPLARCWLHNAFVLIEGRKIAKSLGNVIKLAQIRDRGFSPLALRYLFLQAHYRSPINFTWQSLEAAQHAYRKLREKVANILGQIDTPPDLTEAVRNPLVRSWYSLVAEDLQTPKALAAFWEHVNDRSVPAHSLAQLCIVADEVLGLRLTSPQSKRLPVRSPLPRQAWPERIAALVEEREALRKEKRFAEADEIRERIHREGFTLVDTAEGPVLYAATESSQEDR